MVIVTDINSALKIRNTYVDEKFAVVRSFKKPISEIRITHLPELAPSEDLFYKYLNARKAGNWNQKTFDTMYVPQFIRELIINDYARFYMNKIFEEVTKNHLNLVLACYCKEESLCHRSILAGLLQGAGCEVECGGNYTFYYDMYKEIRNEVLQNR